MNVQQLIEQLQQYPKNMEVKVHNGLVDDWQLFNLTRYRLERWDENFIYKMAMRQCLDRDKNTELPFRIKKQVWEYSESCSENKNKKYKNILLLTPIPRGITSSDRLGTIDY